MRYLNVLLLILFIPIYANAQFVIEGHVRNEKGESLSFTTVFLEETSLAASTDDKGNFNISNVPAGTYKLKATFIGYQAYTETIIVSSDLHLDIVLKGEIYLLDRIEIQGNRVGDAGPFTKQDLNKKELQKENLGQDVPVILQWTPSMVVTSDAGAGIGYTGLRLRGSDQTRINVTINGVPLNDAESQNVFWVDLPDLVSSVNNIQIQRGVGTSTNGAGAFGGTVSINTADVRVNPYIDLATSLGSFNTKKIGVNLGTGLINNRYCLDARYSLIKSDGYVDRATSDLSSYFFSASRVTGKSSLRLNVMSGKERTYQSWYGVPEAKINGDGEKLLTHYYNNLGSIYKNSQDSVNLFSSDRRYNYYTYPDQVDKFRQTHIQLIHALAPTNYLKTKLTFYYTKGNGYYEEFKVNDKFENYSLPEIIDSSGTAIRRSDIVRRRWLDNDLLGLMGDVEYAWKPNLTLQAGFSANTYTGDHFGNVIRSSVVLTDLDKERRYYDNTGQKQDISMYSRAIFELNDNMTLHGDLQWRKVHYEIQGKDNDLRDVDVSESYNFINPKFGIHYKWKKNHESFLSFAVANKEPGRGDFIDYAYSNLPLHEHLKNWELGYKYTNSRLLLESNLYYMLYKNQLVLTGELNDVGASVRVNVPESYRAGIEQSIAFQMTKKWSLNANATWSLNKIKAFDEVIADYTIDFTKEIIHHQNTDISFSPNWIGALQCQYTPHKNIEIGWSVKFVGSQFLDNTSNAERSLPAYNYHNFRLMYKIKSKYVKDASCTLLVNNVLNQLYASNGYTYSYKYESLITENFLYPQAGRNWLLGLKIGL
ncbi:MAG: TonB-dependent receptor [Saprospiraceae bacterium]|nr:TonB-dependent receptor [Saprospiraceae bacterium]